MNPGSITGLVLVQGMRKSLDTLKYWAWQAAACFHTFALVILVSMLSQAETLAEAGMPAFGVVGAVFSLVICYNRLLQLRPLR